MVINITNEREDGALSTVSPLSNDSENYGESSNGDVVLKKGPWTAAEDALLVDYVKQHGEGNWNAVQKHSGLWRCGKSCRLRWANHLRPNLKKGAITDEEERVIIELHAKMGNKWAKMAAHLPGRTDNEIKNYWNTRIKRLQRIGLPLYPSELCLQSHQENHLSRNNEFHDDLQNYDYETPDVMVDSFNISSNTTPQFPNISASGSQSYKFTCPQFHSYVPQRVGYCAQDDACENKKTQSLGWYFQYDPDRDEKKLTDGIKEDSSFMLNSNFSASKPFAGAKKLELPSLQYEETGLGVLDHAPKSVDSNFQFPLSGELPLRCPSPRSSGLLEALLYEAKPLSKSDNVFSDKATSSTISSGDLTNGSSLNTCSTEFKGYVDPTSPLGNSIGSSFNWCTPIPTTQSSMEEDIHDEEMRFDCCRPDALLGYCWLEQSGCPSSKKQRRTTDAISRLLGEDTEEEYSPRDYAYDSKLGLSSCSWDYMPGVCQKSELPSEFPPL